MEKKGIISDRCEMNRQIRRDNALLRQLKAEVQRLMEALKNTIARAIEPLQFTKPHSVRESLTQSHREEKGPGLIKKKRAKDIER